MKNKADTTLLHSKRLPHFILICFFLSGMTALAYEIIWMRMISRVIGGAPFAVSIILGVFMGGMGLGGFVAGKYTDKIETWKLVRTYGLLELSIGIYALFVPVFLIFLKLLYSVLYNTLFEHTFIYHLCIFAGASAVLSFPTICMGATLPILCRFYVSNLKYVGSHAGRLYGLNTIGAATGSLVCGFWLINAFGLWGTMLCAVTLNILIGFICLNIAPSPKPVISNQPKNDRTLKNKKAPPAATPHAAPPKSTHPKKPEHPLIIRGALAIFFASGFCAMAYEVILTKLLGLVVGPTTYSFTIVLVTFILGLALGNLVFGRMADRIESVGSLLIATQLGAALSMIAISHILGNSQLFFAKLIYTLKDNFALLSLTKFLTLFCFMIIPTVFLGATFPLIAKLYTRSVENVGRSIGFAYAINTLGAVLGSFCAGFLLIPLIGKENGLKTVIGLQVITASMVGIIILTRQKKARLQWAALTGAFSIGIALLTAYPSWNRKHLAMGKYHRFDEAMVVDEMIENTGWFSALFNGTKILSASDQGELIFYGDGIGGFTTVLKYPTPFGTAEYSLANSGKMDASSIGDMKTQTMLAHFPMLFSKAAKNVMVLGLASGVTAGEVLHYPIEQLDVVDINDRVFAAAESFSPWNNNVLNDKRSRLILQDGAAHLSLTKTAYDVIISEPSNPWMAGMAALFTREFFTTAKNKLTADGIFVQWFHCYQMDWSTFAMIGRTFAKVFPASLLVSCDPGGIAVDFLFVGFKRPEGLNLADAKRNITFTQKSKNMKLAYPELFYPAIVSEDLNRLFGPGPVNTDDRPILEYAAPKLMYQAKSAQGILFQQIISRRWLSEKSKREVIKIKQSVNMQIDLAAYALSVHAPFKNMVDLSMANAAQKERYYNLLETYCTRNAIDFSLIDDPDMVRQLRDAQITAIQKKLPKMEIKVPAHIYIGSILSDKGLTDEAIAHYEAAIRLDPANTDAHNDLGYILAQSGKPADGIAHFKAALRIRPNFLLALGNIAYTSLKQNNIDDALHYFQKILRISPEAAEPHQHIGSILLQKNKPTLAVKHLKAALHINPDIIEVLNTLATVLATSPDPKLKNTKHAILYAKRACHLSGEADPKLLATLAAAYTADQQFIKAKETYAKALSTARNSGRQDIVVLIEKDLQRLKIMETESM